jgi:hypothetical protein
MKWGKWWWISFGATSDDQAWNEQPKNAFDEEKRGNKKPSKLAIFGKAFADEDRKHRKQQWIGLDLRQGEGA